MAVVDYDSTATQELHEHRRSYMTFERMVLFAAMHIALVLSCLALAFLGNVPLVAFLLGAGGTIALITAFVIMAPGNRT